MINWHFDLYLDKKASKNIKKIKHAINREKPLEDVYCICKPMNPNNLLDIIRAKDLFCPYYKNASVTILGIAYGKEAAVQIIEEMMLEVYQNTDNFDVKGYFLKYVD